jgi:type II secretory pathway pseudopilin PulG
MRGALRWFWPIKPFIVNSRYQGITLVESLVAITILGVCASTFVLALSSGMISARVQNTSVIADSLAQSQMESIKAAVYDSTGGSYSLISVPSGYSIAVQTDSTIYSTANIQKITVTVSYSGDKVSALEDFKVNR